MFGRAVLQVQNEIGSTLLCSVAYKFGVCFLEDFESYKIYRRISNAQNGETLRICNIHMTHGFWGEICIQHISGTALKSVLLYSWRQTAHDKDNPFIFQCPSVKRLVTFPKGRLNFLKSFLSETNWLLTIIYSNMLITVRGIRILALLYMSA